MPSRLLRGAASVALGAALVAPSAIAYAHEGAEDDSLHDNKNLLHAPDNPDGHVAANTNYGYELIGHDALGGVESGRYTDVWAHDGYAYVGTFQEPTCDNSGVYVSDINDPTKPTTIGEIKSPSNTRINDVKVHEIGERDVLLVTYEKCGAIRPGAASGDGRNSRGDNDAKGNNQKGFTGIGYWDVSIPAKPRPLTKYALSEAVGGVHNTFSWTTEAGRTYTLAVDDVAANDLWVLDSTDPTKPQIIAQTGIADWIEQGIVSLDDPQLLTGVFAASLLHDVWVEDMDPGPGEDWNAVLSYWDHGFVTMDVNDPANPVYLDDTDYPETDPVLGNTPEEGNAHAAVFGEGEVASAEGPQSLILGGDEDFDSAFTGVVDGDEEYGATQGSDTPQITSSADAVSGTPVAVGLACDAIDDAPEGPAIALVERGGCAFTTKVGNAEAAGYDAVVVFNSAAGCEASVSMLASGGIPALFVPRSAGFAILDETYEGCATPAPAIGTTAGEITVTAVFDGWGYLHVFNNTGGDLEVKKGMTGDTVTVPTGEEMGYYAPAEVADPQYASGAGDLTMHNLETDPDDMSRSFISWYSLGMRAVEWREGHLHSPETQGQSVASWNMHEVGRWIATPEAYAGVDTDVDPALLEGSNFWGVHVTELPDGQKVILGSDRSTGLHVFTWDCQGVQSGDSSLYCDKGTSMPMP